MRRQSPLLERLRDQADLVGRPVPHKPPTPAKDVAPGFYRLLSSNEMARTQFEGRLVGLLAAFQLGLVGGLAGFFLRVAP